MSTALNPIGQNSATSPVTTGTTPVAAPNDPLANESTFLTLLVSQLKNQDPLSPVDSTQFVSQLTSYSQLEQLIGINKNTSGLSQTSTAATTGGSTSNSSAAI
jgi:flagellar basal-body rod modification protein FlgD